MRMDDCGDRDDLFCEVEHERRLHRRLMANPHPQDPDFPGCDDSDEGEDFDDEQASETTRIACAMSDPVLVRDARWSYGPDCVHAIDVATVRAYQNAALETEPEAADLVAIGLAHYQAVYGQIKREAEADTLEMAMED